MEAAMLTPFRNQRGSALMIAVIAMLIMGVLSLSFSLLANIESRIGVSYKQQAQAEALAEAGLEMARDAVRNAGANGTGFLSVFGNVWGGASKQLNGGDFWARIDNDCAGLNTVSALIEESVGCNNTADNNHRAVLTAWATVGTGAGRARVRAMLGEDDAWKHVCADSKNDANGGICTKNTKGNPTVSPSDQSHENGPKGFDELPRPIIGCSRIDPQLHGQNFSTCTSPNLFAYPAVAAGSYGTVSPGYPQYPNLSGSNHVIMGEDPAITTLAPFAARVKTCNNDTGVGGTGRQYFGYFDCALTTYCDPAAGHNCPGLNPTDPPRKACLHPSDSRAPGNPNQNTLYYDAPTLDGGGNVTVSCSDPSKLATGMVYLGTPSNFKGNIGSTSRAMVIYVAQPNTGAAVPSVQFGPQDLQFYGAIVVEGNLESKNKADMCTGWPNATPGDPRLRSEARGPHRHSAGPPADHDRLRQQQHRRGRHRVLGRLPELQSDQRPRLVSGVQDRAPGRDVDLHLRADVRKCLATGGLHVIAGPGVDRPQVVHRVLDLHGEHERLAAQRSVRFQLL
jgi:Tfp pilus assembly protein PilX